MTRLQWLNTLRLRVLFAFLLILALLTIPWSVRADGDPPGVEAPIGYPKVAITVAQQWPVVAGGVMALKLKVDYQGAPPPIGWIIVKPKWPTNASDGVSPGAADITGTLPKFWPVYPNGDAYVIVPIPADVTVDSAPPVVGVELDFAALVPRSNLAPLYYWGHVEHEQPVVVP